MTIDELERLRTSTEFQDRKDQLKNHVYARSTAAFDAGDAARDAVRDPAALRARQQAMRSVLVASMGGLPPSDHPLSPEIRGCLEEPGLRIERVVFQSRPGVYVTANLYLPAGPGKPTGAVLFLIGHWAEGRLCDEYQVVCRCLARAGLVVLAQDPVGLGERWSYWEPSRGAATVAAGTAEHEYAGAPCLLVGDGIARYFVHDAMRGIDYLRTRPEVDPARIGVTGNSGGGTQTCLLMVCDPRIAAAAPATFVMSRRSFQQTGMGQDAEQIWRGVSAAGFDHEDVLLAMVPRPVLVLAARYDYFPIGGTRITVARCRRLWEMAGAKDGLEMFEDAIEHHYSPRMAVKAAEFFSRHLNGKPVTPDAAGIGTVAARTLWCTASGQVRGEIPGARGVFEENVERLEAIAARRIALSDATRRAEAERWLRAKVYGNHRPCEPDTLHLREWFGPSEPGFSSRLCLWWSQEGIRNGAVLFRDPSRDGQRLPLSIGLWQHGTGDAGRHRRWIRDTADAGRAAMVLDVSGYGMLEPNAINAAAKFANYGTLFKLADDLVWLDDSLPALRTWELIRALDVVASTFDDVDPSDLSLRAEGRCSLYAELAAFLDPRFRRLELVDRFEGFADLVRSRHYVDADVKSIVMPGVLEEIRPRRPEALEVLSRGAAGPAQAPAQLPEPPARLGIARAGRRCELHPFLPVPARDAFERGLYREPCHGRGRLRGGYAAARPKAPDPSHEPGCGPSARCPCGRARDRPRRCRWSIPGRAGAPAPGRSSAPRAWTARTPRGRCRNAGGRGRPSGSGPGNATPS